VSITAPQRLSSKPWAGAAIGESATRKSCEPFLTQI
jgi:hypothetical protein